ncbi:hypothetical protein GGS23DRAFT_601639 [Durotheca rogersii]|uniref:uncharacterized protein n=1 Tax=Durotheca rogersii TaxID=419775 RepID=UPI0022201133|nr:uncharacterized protein GGS23DRAFT_601639 [Durotheca rogersii]KAI5854097.1 hypothetical protein GGS23DRAFT_601639 [Durotheca rogersii]
MDEKSAARIAKSRGKNDSFAKRADMAARNNKDQSVGSTEEPCQRGESSQKKDGGEQAK